MATKLYEAKQLTIQLIVSILFLQEQLVSAHDARWKQRQPVLTQSRMLWKGEANGLLPVSQAPEGSSVFSPLGFL